MTLLRRLWAWLRSLWARPAPVKVDRHPWNTPKKRMVRLYTWANRPRPQQHMLSKRERGKRRGKLKRLFGLSRRQNGAIGAGHLNPPEGYYPAHIYWELM